MLHVNNNCACICCRVDLLGTAEQHELCNLEDLGGSRGVWTEPPLCSSPCTSVWWAAGTRFLAASILLGSNVELSWFCLDNAYRQPVLLAVSLYWILSAGLGFFFSMMWAGLLFGKYSVSSFSLTLASPPLSGRKKEVTGAALWAFQFLWIRKRAQNIYMSRSFVHII